MAGRQRTSFDKLQRERARLEKQAAKRARRQGKPEPGGPFTPGALDDLTPVGESQDPDAPVGESQDPDAPVGEPQGPDGPTKDDSPER